VAVCCLFAASSPGPTELPSRSEPRAAGRWQNMGMRVQRGQRLAYDGMYDTPPVTWYYPSSTTSENMLGYTFNNAEYQTPEVMYTPTTYNSAPTSMASGDMPWFKNMPNDNTETHYDFADTSGSCVCTCLVRLHHRLTFTCCLCKSCPKSEGKTDFPLEKSSPPILVIIMWCAAARPRRATHKYVARVHVHTHPRAHAHHSPIHTLVHTTTLSRTHIHQRSQRRAGRTRGARSQLLAKVTGHWCRRPFCMGSVFLLGNISRGNCSVMCECLCVFLCVCVCVWGCGWFVGAVRLDVLVNVYICCTFNVIHAY